MKSPFIFAAFLFFMHYSGSECCLPSFDKFSLFNTRAKMLSQKQKTKA